MDLNKSIKKKVSDRWGSNSPRSIEATVENIIRIKLPSREAIVDAYNNVFNEVNNGAQRDDILKKYTDGDSGLPKQTITDMIEKAEMDLRESPDPHELSEEYTRLPKNNTPETQPRSDKMSGLTQTIEDVIGARLIEHLAGTGESSISHVAQQIQEDPVRVTRVASKLHQQGIVDQHGSTIVISAGATAQLQEMVVADGISLMKAATILKESTNSPGEGVTDGDQVQDHVPNPSADQGQPDPATNSDIGSGDITTVPTDEGQDEVQRAINENPDAPLDPANSPADGGGPGTGSDIGSNTTTEQKSVHDAVPFDSANTGKPPLERDSELPGSGTNQ